MSIRVGGALAATAIWLLVLNPLAFAQEPPQSTVFATVDGIDITSRDIGVAIEAVGSELERVPEQVRLSVLVDIIVNQQLFAKVAREAGIEDNENYKRRVEYSSGRALRDTYVEVVLAETITEDDIAARYEIEIKDLPAQEELRARHILIASEAEANVLKNMLNDGADFAELATVHSTGPSAVQGGDLDYFTTERMVPEFSSAANALEVGAVSDPVKTEFGWHLIKLEDRRQRPPPPLEDVRDHMKALVLRDQIKEKTDELREAADISYASQPEPGAAGSQQ